MEIATDVVVDLEDRPHSFAAFAEALALAGITLEGMCGLYVDGTGIDHVLLDDVERARGALSDAGFRIRAERDVLVLDVRGRSRELARVARQLADAGVEIELVYTAGERRLVLGVDDVANARAALTT